MKRPSWLPAKFDRDAAYIWTRPARVAGRDVRAGDQVDKTKFSTRQLTSLLRGRRIAPAPATATPPSAAETRHVGRGRYALFVGQRRVSEPMTRDEADAALATA